MTQTLVKTIADFSTTLVSKVAVGDTTATLTSGLDEDGVQLPTGTYGFTIDRNNSQKEYFTATLTGSNLTNIKHVTRGTAVASTGFSSTHRKGAEVVITDHVAIKRMMDVLDGTTQFDSGTILGYDGTATATTPNQLITKAQLDATALGTVTVTTVLVPGNAGEVVAAGNLVYLDVADGEWKLCDANTAATVDNIQLGIAQGAGTDGVAISGGVIISGLDTHQTGLTNNTTYYASDTAGAISTTPGSVEVTVGVSRSTTSLLFSPRYNQQLTEDQQDALVGTSGTPSSTNKFVTNDDTTGTGSVVRASVTSAIAKFGGDGTDGALAITTGTTTINLGSAAYVEKNYTSISITGDGVLAFSNPHANGTTIVLRSQGDVTLTSSATPMIDASALGATAATQATSLGEVAGTLGAAGASGASSSNSSGGAAGSAYSSLGLELYTTTTNKLHRKSIFIYPGSGGMSGGNGYVRSGTAGTGGAGGRGGGALYIECKGAWNFTTASGISVAGANGSAGTNASGTCSSGGGGGSGGRGGMFLALYNTLTANSGTVNISSGAGGNGGNASNTAGADQNGSGGAGGGTPGGVSGAGQAGADGTSASNGSNGSNGAGASGGGTTVGATTRTGGTGGTPHSSSGISVVAKNTWFA